MNPVPPRTRIFVNAIGQIVYHKIRRLDIRSGEIRGPARSLGHPRGFDALEDRPEVDARAAPWMRVAMDKHGGCGAVGTELLVRVRREIGDGVDRDAELGRDVLFCGAPGMNVDLNLGSGLSFVG